eukprot:9155357-Alexandrium_andersonii.AAC.2
MCSRAPGRWGHSLGNIQCNVTMVRWLERLIHDQLELLAFEPKAKQSAVGAVPISILHTISRRSGATSGRG